MADDSSRRIQRLAKRAKQLDDVIKKAAEMQKRIVTEIQRLGSADQVSNKRPTRTPNSSRRRIKKQRKRVA